jgi:uroporphyrinogen decarboxylase
MSDFLKVLQGKPQGERINPPPIWLMRQAGRYLPEYRELRAKAGGFMQMALTPELAAVITLQPIRRYPQLDAAIIFSDILVTPYALGMDLQFHKGEGPVLPALDDAEQDLIFQPDLLEPIYEALRRVRSELPVDKALIGFAGSPWTVACYMISGRNHDDFVAAKRWAFAQPEKLDAVLDLLCDVTIHYLGKKIEAGANAVQLFDSWAGLLVGHDAEFERFIIKPTQKIVSRLKENYPHIPIIGFPRQAGQHLQTYAQINGLNGLGLDWSADIVTLAKTLPSHLALQGNLDPQILVAGGVIMEQKIRIILDAMRDRPFIFNLGHGIVPQTPPEHVAQLLAIVKGA